MPIQPLPPTLRLKSALKAPSMPPPCGSRLPASIYLAMNVRTSLRSASHSGGKRMASNVSCVAMTASLARGEHRPQTVGALGGHQIAEFHGPSALIAEIVAPGPQAASEAVQRVLLREADGAKHLMRDGRAFARRLAHSDLRRCSFEQDCFIEDGGARDRIGSGTGRCNGSRGLAGKPRQVVLHGLELGDRSLKSNTLVGIAHRQLEDGLQRTGHLHGARRRAHEL